MAVSKTISATGSHGYHTFTMTVSETAVNTSANTSTCTVKFTIKPKVTGYNWEDYSTSSSNCPHGTVYFNGSHWDWALGAYDGKSTVTLVNKPVTVAHNSDGSKTITGTSSNSQFRFECHSGSDYYLPGDASSHGSITLTKIDQTPTVTQKISSRTEESITMQWNSDIAISKVEYRIGTSGTWTSKTVSGTKSGTYKLTGLQANTSYTIQTRLTSKGSGKTATASGSFKTYNWPYATVGDFNVKDGYWINVTNPLGREGTVDVYAEGRKVLTVIGELSDTYIDPADVANNMLSEIPNSMTGTWYCTVTYGEHVSTSATANYSAAGYNPTITSVDYVDVNATAQAIIRDTSVIVQNISTPRFTVTGTGLYGAKLASGTVQILGTTNNLTVSSENVIVGTTGTINSASDVVAVVTAVDTRGNSVVQNVTVEMLEYTAPNAVITLNRQSNFYSQTDLTVDAEVLAIGDNQPTITAKWKEVGASSWAGTQTIPDNVTTALNGATGLDNTKEWEVEVTVVDTLGGASVFGGYFVGIGLPILFIDRVKRSVGINSFPTASEQLMVNDIDVMGELFYKSGDTMTIDDNVHGGVPFNGYITATAKTMRFMIPTEKLMTNVSNITCTVCTGGIRGVAGYVNGSRDFTDWLSDDTITFTMTKVTERLLQMELSRPTAYSGATNNTPVVFAAVHFELEFS